MTTEGTNAMGPSDASTNVDSPAKGRAKALMLPAVQAAITVTELGKNDSGEVDLLALIENFAAQALTLKSGDLTDAERMLMAQATTLDVLFNNLVRRAAALTPGVPISTFDTFLRLALKAQSQCRATLETLSIVKNPRSVAFVRQANITNGPQQVNNRANHAGSRARKSGKNRPNKLLETLSDERLDRRTAKATVHIDTAMATLGTIDRSPYRTRKSTF